jgi:polysaccharide biosynthesis/export protein
MHPPAPSRSCVSIRRAAIWLPILAIAVLCPCLLSAQSSLRPAYAVPGPSSDSVISPDDVLEIYIMDVPELSRQYRVSEAGTVVLPMAEKPLEAAGLKVTDFASAVAQQLRDEGLVSNPRVTVSITASRLRSVAITGAVKLPQIYPVFGHTTLLDILSQAQGLTEDAGNLAVISRGEVGAEAAAGRNRTETVDLTKLLQSGDPAYNVELYPGDRVTVPRAGIVYVVGAVNKPGGFPIKQSSDGITVLQALALAEDAKSTARRDKTVVIRRDPTAPEGYRQIPLELKKILAGKAEDPSLQANDVLFVPDSSGKKAMRRSLEAALGAATMLTVYRP